MGALKSINKNPLFTKYLVAKDYFLKDKFRVIDIGARGGAEDHWDYYNDQVTILGFEPDPKECLRLNKRWKNSNKVFYPVALSNNAGTRDFFITKYLASSGFYKPDPKFWSRFPDGKHLAVRKKISIKTTTLDIFSKTERLTSIDFIKLDVEGAELDILKGAVYCLKTAFGLSLEIEFSQVHEKQPVFNAVDAFVNKLGFKLYDLQINRIARNTLSPNMFTRNPSPTPYGQVLWAQAIYLRDPVPSLQRKNYTGWHKTKILKLASFMELLNLQDCAIELLLESNRQNIISKTEAEIFTDLMALGKFSKKYSEYVETLKKTQTENKEKIQLAKLLSRVKLIIPVPIRKMFYIILVETRKILDTIIKANYGE